MGHYHKGYSPKDCPHTILYYSTCKLLIPTSYKDNRDTCSNKDTVHGPSHIEKSGTSVFVDALGMAENVLISEVVILYTTPSSWDLRQCPD